MQFDFNQTEIKQERSQKAPLQHLRDYMGVKNPIA
jgi:hypothetical protein